MDPIAIFTSFFELINGHLEAHETTCSRSCSKIAAPWRSPATAKAAGVFAQLFITG